jgi:hypothetical protein
MEDRMYKADHIKVLKALAGKLPKRLTLKTADIVMQEFSKDNDGDRRVRNAYRKLRNEEHIEIIRRGEYRLTNSGAALCRRLKKNNWNGAVALKKIRKPPKRKTKTARKKKDSGSVTLGF